MKIRNLLAVAILATTAMACNSTSSVSQPSEEELLAQEPVIQLTVAAQTLSAWPYARDQLTYTLKNHDITITKAAGISKWKQMAEESLVNRLATLGLTQKQEGPAKLTITYGLTEPGDTTASSDQVFNTLGLTAGGKNGSIDVSIVDNLSGRSLWSGSVGAQSDKPLLKDSTKKRVINSLIDSLTGKLPEAK